MHALLSQDPDTWDAAVARHRRRLKALETVDAYCDALAAAGWTDGWGEADVTALRARVAAAWERTPRHLYVYPALRDVSFDTEGFVGGGEYASLIAQLAEATRAGFAPTGIEETASHQDEDDRPTEVDVKFTCAGETFAASFDQDDDWCKNEPLELVEKALDAAGALERFIVLPTSDQILSAAFVRPEAFQKALEDDLLPNAAVVV